MKVKFSIDFRTVWGQRLFVCGSVEALGAWNQEKALPMVPSAGEQWLLEVELSTREAASFEYKYFLLDERSGTVEWEGNPPRSVSGTKGFTSVDLRDFWHSKYDVQNPLYTSPFSEAIFKQKLSEKKPATQKTNANYRFRLRLPRSGSHHVPVLVGGHRSLGNWGRDGVVPMVKGENSICSADVALGAEDWLVEYKYVMYNTQTGQIDEWEAGDNRKLLLEPGASAKSLVVVTDAGFRFQQGNWRGAGVAIPVFSLRSEAGTGVGEFTDIKLLVDWAVKTGNKLIQVLPVNDTVASHTWIDSYPYAGISVFALHPIYANLQAIGPLKDKKKEKEFGMQRAALNAIDHVDYEKVMQLKSAYFKLAFDEQKDDLLASDEFRAFFKRNEKWLVPYAVFSCLRDKFGTPDFKSWPKHAVFNQKEVAQFAAPGQKHFDDVAVHYFIQFYLDRQLKQATAYARQNGVVLKGDIPIGIFRYSVDAWMAPHLYNMDCQAGAPPDDFSVTGQNWGFPTYNWQEMARDGYAWWKERLAKMSDYFDVFRIDHILGFFRIWEIPMDAVEGLLGHFNPCLPFSTHELGQWGLQVDTERFCEPYIRTYMLAEIFGDRAAEVTETYLQEYEPDKYRFKETFNTQRKVKQHLDKLIADHPEEKSRLVWLRDQLFRLHAEVLLLPGETEGSFNPRIGLHSSYSFRDLEPHAKDVMDRLYVHYFYKRHNDFWRDRAMEKLPAIREATNMLICGEDLGMVPESVPGVMAELQILSLAVQRMPNNPEWEFWHPANTSYLSVTTTSSHDTSTLRGWWEEDRGQIQRFYNHILGQAGDAPQFCEPWIASMVVRQHMEAPAMWAIFPIQDLLAMDDRLRRVVPQEERINVPAISQHYWKYRLHLTLEQLLKEEGFNARLLEMANESGRNTGY